MTWMGLMAVNLLIWIYLIYRVHIAVLWQGRPEKRPSQTRLIGFGLRAIGLGALLLLVFVIGTALLVSWHRADNGDIEVSNSLVIQIWAALDLAFLLVFGLFGTLLPAYVANKGRGLGMALARTRAQFLWIFGHLLLGPLLLTGIALAAWAWVVFDFNLNDAALDHVYPMDFSNLILVTLIALLNALGTVMTAWILSTAFMRDGSMAR